MRLKTLAWQFTPKELSTMDDMPSYLRNKNGLLLAGVYTSFILELLNERVDHPLSAPFPALETFVSRDCNVNDVRRSLNWALEQFGMDPGELVDERTMSCRLIKSQTVGEVQEE